LEDYGGRRGSEASYRPRVVPRRKLEEAVSAFDGAARARAPLGEWVHKGPVRPRLLLRFFLGLGGEILGPQPNSETF
jgi:hypothetical protein